MSSTVAGSSTPAGASTGDEARSDPAMADRGVTTISPTVIEKIAGRAAAEVPGVTTARPSSLRRLIPLVDDGTADAAVGRERAAVDLTISVRYPAPVWQKADQVRTAVTERNESLTGLKVTRVNITISQLTSGSERVRRVV